MRLAKASAVAGAAALLISAITALPAAQAQQDADKKVAGGGITVKGWQGRVDTGNRQGLTIAENGEPGGPGAPSRREEQGNRCPDGKRRRPSAESRS